MAKFTFPIPGRNKRAAGPPVPAENMSKAHKILGSNTISIDSHKAWDAYSASGISITISEQTAQAVADLERLGVDKSANNTPRIRNEWGDESDVVPHYMHSHALPGAFEDDYSSSLRERPSSSTMKSWYDKTKLPLAVSQQTSASAMAKGLPSKAHKLLDMDNFHATKKKKPSVLDFSLLKPSSRTNTDWERPVLGNDFVTRSPSILSPFIPSPRKLLKRTTRETLHVTKSEAVKSKTVDAASDVANARTLPSHMSQLPDLYQHYEQMSFAQILEEDEKVLHSDKLPQEVADQDVDTEKSSEPSLSFNTVPDMYSQSPSDSQRSRHEDPLKSHPTQGLCASPTANSEQASSNSYAPTISSRHTQTSKASKHTSQSFAMADLQEQSVLMLSSDSESDGESEVASETQLSTRRAETSFPLTRCQSKPELLLNPSYGVSLTCTEEYDQRCSQAIKRTSTAPAGFVTVPNQLSCQIPSPDPSVAGSQTGSKWVATLQPPASPAGSIRSKSSVSTGMTWQGPTEYGVYEARAVTMLAAQGPSERDSEADTDSDLEYERPEAVVRQGSEAGAQTRKRSITSNSSRKSGSVRASMITTSSRASTQTVTQHSQPTPPLSPESVDFLVRSSQQFVESPKSPKEHIMGLTRQEQMLITALRQRREDMKRSSFSSGERPNLHRPVKGHMSNPSESTITEDSFNFGFPAPPSSDNSVPLALSNTSSMSELLIPGGNGDDEKSNTVDGTVFVLSPPPSHHKTQQNLETPAAIYESRRNTCDSFTSSRSIKRERIAARSRRAQQPIYEEEPPSMPPPKQKLPSPPSRKNSYPAPKKITDVAQQLAGAGAGFADVRPESPISPITDAFPEVPKKRQTLNSARLSAFGPPALDAGWWADED